MMRFCIFIASLFLCLSLEAQQQPAATQPVQLSPLQQQELQMEIADYMQLLTNVAGQIAGADGTQLKQLQLKLQSIDAQWQTFSATEQNDIASSPILMELMGQYKESYTATNDSITSQMERLVSKAKFNAAAAFINKAALTYDDLVSQAKKYSLVKQTAARLANVQAQDQILMQQVSEKFAQATAAASACPDLKSKLDALNEKYVSIQEMSKTIQASQYKPWIERVKDYIMSFAATAIIIMFITVAIQRVAALKKAREMAKKYGGMMNGTQDDIPTI